MIITNPRTLDEIQISTVLLEGDTFRTIAEALVPLDQIPNGDRSTRLFGNKKVAWFPKIAIEKNINGTLMLVPQTDTIEWRNTLSSDYAELLQRKVRDVPTPNNFDERFDVLSVEFAIFAKLTEEQKYTFLGIYRKMYEKDIYGADVFRRVSKYLSIDEWKEANI